VPFFSELVPKRPSALNVTITQQRCFSSIQPVSDFYSFVNGVPQKHVARPKPIVFSVVVLPVLLLPVAFLLQNGRAKVKRARSLCRGLSFNSPPQKKSLAGLRVGVCEFARRHNANLRKTMIVLQSRMCRPLDVNLGVSRGSSTVKQEHE
jgi:hypothetical protein